MITSPHLEELDDAVNRALATGDESSLHVLGYGEINTVVAWPKADGPYACKRLPIFDDVGRFEAYRAVFDDYMAALQAAGVTVHESHLVTRRRPDGAVVSYCIQPVLAPETLGPRWLRNADADGARTLFTRIVEHIRGTVRPTLGIDAQLSNWAIVGDDLVYLDVTTPLLRDEEGRDRLDTELFMASLPAIMRPFVRRFLLDGILDPYYSLRRAAIDVAGNLHKERLAERVPLFVEIANERLGVDLSVAEVHRYYRRDARLWSLLQRARRVDRAWQRHVRRRPYQYLLPGPVDRRPGEHASSTG